MEQLSIGYRYLLSIHQSSQKYHLILKGTHLELNKKGKVFCIWHSRHGESPHSMNSFGVWHKTLICQNGYRLKSKNFWIFCEYYIRFKNNKIVGMVQIQLYLELINWKYSLKANGTCNKNKVHVKLTFYITL